jgi:hypothetical protein
MTGKPERPKPDSQKCSNNHPADNSGRCRESSCPFSKHPDEKPS